MSRLSALSGLFKPVDVQKLSAKEQRDLLTEIRLRRELRQERLRPIGYIFRALVIAWILLVILHILHVL